MKPDQKNNRILFWVALSLPMLALVGMTWLVHQAGGQFNDSFNWVLKNYKVLDKFEQMEAHVVDAEANQRGFLLTGKTEYLEPYRAAMGDLTNDMADLKRLTRDEPAQQVHIEMIEQLITGELVFDPAGAYSSGQFQTNASVLALTARGKQKIEALRRVLFQAREEQEQDLNKHQQAAEREVVSGQIMSLVLIAAVAVALVFVVMILVRLDRLQQFVTVCAWTGQVKFEGEWMRLDQFLERRFGISVSHSLSKDAAEKMMQEIEDLKHPGAAGGLPPVPPAKLS
jgi:CHASE3 domain sensor protein